MTPESSDRSTRQLRWFKSSYSGSNNNDCVEIAHVPGTVHVRDSKNAHGPRLALTADVWAEFVADVTTR